MKAYHKAANFDRLRANFLVPTLMDKVYLEGERQASLEVEHQLLWFRKFYQTLSKKI